MQRQPPSDKNYNPLRGAKSIGKTSWQVKQRWKEKNYTRIAIDLPNQLAEELKAKAEAEGRSRTALIKELLEKYLHK